MPNILDEIVAAKTQELAQQKLAVSLADLKKTIAAQPKALSLAEALRAGGVQLIAEVKKASPSRGLLRPNFDSWLVKGAYVIGGFSTIVVLHILLDLSGLNPNLHYPLAFIGAPLAWMTGTYTGWLLKQAKGRTEWARRSSARIAVTGTIELLALGFLIPALAFIQSGTPDPVLVTREPYMIYAIVWGLLVWFGFKHIRADLREAQMEPLL